jgi:hypothetical protein
MYSKCQSIQNIIPFGRIHYCLKTQSLKFWHSHSIPKSCRFHNLVFFLTFMWPCIINVFKHNQQDTTLHNGIYYHKCSICFRQFLCPSSGAQNSIQSIGYLSSFPCFLPLSWVGSVYSFELLMMGGGTAWNM